MRKACLAQKREDWEGILLNILREDTNRMRLGCFLCYLTPWQVVTCSNWNTGNSIHTWETANSLWGWLSTGTSYPELVEYSSLKIIRTHHCALGDPAWNREVRVDNLRWSLPTSTICNSVVIISKCHLSLVLGSKLSYLEVPSKSTRLKTLLCFLFNFDKLEDRSFLIIYM